MARKAKGKAVPPATTPRAKPVRLDLEPEIHRLLRLVAADANMSMAAYAREMLERHLREVATQKGIKA